MSNNYQIGDYAETYRTFKQTVPEICRGCAYERSCQGGCKESAFATFGDHTHPEPLVWLYLLVRLPHRFPYLLLALIDAWRDLPTALRWRRHIQRSRRVSAAYIRQFMRRI